MERNINNDYYLVIDCEPLRKRPDEILKNMLINTKISIDDFKELSSFLIKNGAYLFTENYKINQCIVNNYSVGQGISKHIDVKSYGNVIGCFTINSGATMIFRHLDKSINLYVEPNSLYIMSGEARYLWSHEMTTNKYDKINDTMNKRDRRISITFRNVP